MAFVVEEWRGVAVALGLWVLRLAVVYSILRRLNGWIHEWGLGKERRSRLPPGDLGWPVVGKMWSFLYAFKTGRPDNFIGAYVKRYGRTGIYKSFMFGSPTVLLTTPETTRKALMDEANFIPGWPITTQTLIGRKSFAGPTVLGEEHKRLRRLTSAPINGFDALSTYLHFIEETELSCLKAWSSMGEIEFLTELRKMTFRIIMHIFVSVETESVIHELEKAYASINYAIRAMAINIPGFAYHKALKARKKAVAILQSVIDMRKVELREGGNKRQYRDMMDRMLDSEDENGTKLTDEQIIDVLVMYLNAGHESSGHMTMWCLLLLQQYPEMMKKAKEEQEEIRRSMPRDQKGLTLKETRKMIYLNKVIDEALRFVNVSFLGFREAANDVEVNGYLIPKGWKVQIWNRNVHMDPLVYEDPKVFNPNRLDGITPKAGTFLAFGAGSRLCPGNDLARMEICVFMHYFLIDYELVRSNPNCRLRYLPHPRPIDNCKGRVKKLSSIAS